MYTGKVKTLFSDKAKTEILFPVTKTSAVSDEDGVGLDALLDKAIYASEEEKETLSAPINVDTLGGLPASGYATKEFVTGKVTGLASEDFVTSAINNAQFSGDIDLSIYATKHELANIDFPVDSINGKTGNVQLTAEDVGAAPVGSCAPSGFGLGVMANSLPAIADANDAVNTGWYKITSSTANAIGASAMLRVEAREPGYVLQTEIRATTGKERKRTCIGGTWSEWVDASPSAFAPSGYGLGDLCVEISDWNNATKNGFYISTGNSPDGNKWWGFVVANSANYIEQRVFRTAGGTLAEMHRSKYNGTWQSWVDCSPSAFAPAGYGLGENSVIVTDLNKCTQNGWYWTSTDSQNTPTEMAYAAIYVKRRTANHIVQELTGILTNRGCKMVRTSTDAGVTWVEEWENPPMVTGTEYRTTERIHGKAVYKKADSAGRIKYRLDGETEWKPIHYMSDIFLTEGIDYGSELPTAGTQGRLFFKVVE